ncbi:MAG: FKBP-type peptidyl-prolyl cis-trans isomerase [Thermoproteota archaeon]
MIKDGSFVLLDYVATVKETNEVFSTTREEAKKAGLFRAGEEYEPSLLIVGSAWFPRGLEESLTGHEKGEQLTIELAPEKAYGLRDASKIKSYPLRKFRNMNSKLQPGARVEIDNRIGVIRSIGAGRVQVDFNLPLAGKTLIYMVEIKDVIEGTVPKVLALLHRRIPSIPIEKFNVRFEGGNVTIEMPNEAFLIEGLQIIKRALFNDVAKFLPEVKEVVFVERYVKEEKEPTEKSHLVPVSEPEVTAHPELTTVPAEHSTRSEQPSS